MAIPDGKTKLAESQPDRKPFPYSPRAPTMVPARPQTLLLGLFDGAENLGTGETDYQYSSIAIRVVERIVVCVRVIAVIALATDAQPGCARRARAYDAAPATVVRVIVDVHAGAIAGGAVRSRTVRHALSALAALSGGARGAAASTVIVVCICVSALRMAT